MQKQTVTLGLKALIEAVKIRDAAGVEQAIGRLKGLMIDVVNEVYV